LTVIGQFLTLTASSILLLLIVDDASRRWAFMPQRTWSVDVFCLCSVITSFWIF